MAAFKKMTIWREKIKLSPKPYSLIPKRGFTLIEIMFAGVILSFGLVLVLGSFATALEGIKRSENVKIASYLLEEKMEEVKEKAKEEGGVVKGNTFGEFGNTDYTDYKWSLSVNQSNVDEDLNEVKLEISWTEGKNQRSLFATTYLENRD